MTSVQHGRKCATERKATHQQADDETMFPVVVKGGEVHPAGA